MTAPSRTMADIAERLLQGADAAQRVRRLAPRPPAAEPLPPHLPRGNDHTAEGLAKRRRFLRERGVRIDALAAGDALSPPESLRANIENLVGFAALPVGVIGPLRVNGSAAHGDVYVPMATTEGALVASYNRGARVVSLAGGAAALCLTESVSRAPCFSFAGLAESVQFAGWVLEHLDELRKLVSAQTRHGELVDLRTALTGKEVYLVFDFHTGDAAGQNMVTLATDAICRHLETTSPVRPRHWTVEGNLSGDKKATMQSFLYARGRKVIAEAVIPANLLRRFLHVNVEDMVRYWQISTVGGSQSGSIGVQGHYANALAAIFAACGQDIACTAEASVGITRMDFADEGALYASVTLPNLIVGTVGGGTGLPTARECLEMMDCCGDGRARKFAEIVAATALAGEISIIAALAGGHFSRAHRRYGRAP